MYNENTKIIQQLWNTTHFTTSHVITVLELVELHFVEHTMNLQVLHDELQCVCVDSQAESHKANWRENPCQIY